jgi:hypothetical protein
VNNHFLVPPFHGQVFDALQIVGDLRGAGETQSVSISELRPIHRPTKPQCHDQDEPEQVAQSEFHTGIVFAHEKRLPPLPASYNQVLWSR